MRQQSRGHVEGDQKYHKEQIHPQVGAGLVRLHRCPVLFRHVIARRNLGVPPVPKDAVFMDSTWPLFNPIGDDRCQLIEAIGQCCGPGLENQAWT